VKTDVNPQKPLGRKAYGSIGHLPCSRLGPSDSSVHEGQARILTERVRDKHDIIIVQEKLDGCNVAVAKVGGRIVALNRAGYLADSSRWPQHRQFARWVYQRAGDFDFVHEGCSLSGEWLGLAHGTIYDLAGRSPFVAFDLFDERGERMLFDDFCSIVPPDVATPPLVSQGNQAVAVSWALTKLGEQGAYGATEPIEGVVYRCERLGKVEFLAKYVRPDKADGKYLTDVSGQPTIWLYEESNGATS